MNKYLLFLILSISTILFSCSGSASDEGTDVVTFIKISSNENTLLLGNIIKFTATDNLNNNVTENAQFYINGNLNEDGSNFIPQNTGTYEITAKYENVSSKPISIEVVSTSGVNFVHRILYEDFTGTWCGNCPLATVRYENLIAQNENVVFLGVHGPDGSDDPYINSTSLGIIDLRGVWGFPTILINGKYTWSTSNNNYTDMSFPLQYIQPYSKIGISINSTLSGNNVSGEVNVSFAENYNNLKASIFVVENDLHYSQHNYFNGTGGKPILFGGVSIVENYTHHNVVRDQLSSISGDAIPSAQSQENTLFSKPINYTIPSDFVKENLKIIVIISDSNGEVLNTREAFINTDNNLETI